MQSDNKLFEDFAKMMNGLAGTFAGMGREAQETGREKMKSLLGGFDFVGRDEFEAVKAMAAAARDDVDALRAEVAALKASHGQAPAATPDAGTAQRAE